MTTTSANETRIEIDQKVPLVRFTRVFEAPAEHVFRAHVDPHLIVQWLGPRRHSMSIETWDCRVGGSYRYVHVSDGFEAWFRGCFHDVVPDRLLVQTFAFEGIPEAVALEKMTFENLPDGRSCLVATSLVDSFEARDAFVSTGLEEGASEGYERLDELLAKG